MNWLLEGFVMGIVIGVVLVAHAEWRGKRHPPGTLLVAVILATAARLLAGRIQ